MSRTLKIIVAINLLVLAVLTFAYAHLMVAPGKLIADHKQLNTDCFACHTVFTGVKSEKCVGCHKTADIGLRTTVGLPVAKSAAKTPFHQQLKSADCLGCHSDHAGVKRYQIVGRFNHALLQKEANDQCQACHKAPTDSLHTQITGNCAQCHTQQKWTPATFDHDKYFLLDQDHNTTCSTCHVRNDYKRFTCYGCHEHTPDNIRRKHIKEGISKYDNCVECHRSADEDDIRGGEGERQGKRKKDD